MKFNIPLDVPLKEFVQNYLPQNLPLNWHHELFYDILSNEIVQENDKLVINKSERVNREIIILTPRFHAKSTCFTINYPIWEIYKNPNIRILIVSANQDIAASFSRAILNHLENNERLIKAFGDLRPFSPRRWGERTFIVERDTMEKDPTVAAIGTGGKLISKRADIIILDDILDLENARTPQMRQKTKEWFENVLYPILEDNGRLIICGTSWFKNDLYDELMQRPEYDIRLKLKALLYDQKYIRKVKAYSDKKEYVARYFIPYELHQFPQALKIQDVFSDEVIRKYELFTKLKCGVLWKDKWSFEKLMEQKSKMSHSSFMRQYMNEPVSEEEKLFKEKYTKIALERGNHKSLVPSWDNLTLEPYPVYGHLIIAIGVDLAISKKKTSGKTAIAVWGLNEKRDRILLFLDSGRWSPEETKMKILEYYYAFKPIKIRVETVAFQDMLRQELADEDIPIEGFHTTGFNKYDENTGIAHLSMLLEQEKMIIPSAKTNIDYYDRVKQLLYEMSVYSPETHAGDLLMATWFACGVLREFDKKLSENRGYFSTRALVEHKKRVRAASRVVLLGYKPPVFKVAANSLVYIFRPVERGVSFIEPEETFMIFATRQEKSCAYIFEKSTSELVGKIEGDLTILSWVSLLEKAGYFFNTAQIAIDRTSEGDGTYQELLRRNYPKLLVKQPDENGYLTIKEGIYADERILPLAIDYFKQAVDGVHIKIPDDQLLSEMAELIKVEGNRLVTSYGVGQRIRTAAVGFWLIDQYERDKRVYNRKKIKKELRVPYLVFANK